MSSIKLAVINSVLSLKSYPCRARLPRFPSRSSEVVLHSLVCICLKHENDRSASELSIGRTASIQRSSDIGKRIRSASSLKSEVTDFSMQCCSHLDISYKKSSSDGMRCFHLDKIMSTASSKYTLSSDTRGHRKGIVTGFFQYSEGEATPGLDLVCLSV